MKGKAGLKKCFAWERGASRKLEIKLNMACMVLHLCEHLGRDLFHNSQNLIRSNKSYCTYIPLCCY